MSVGCSPILPLWRKIISNALAFSRSCMWSASAASLPSDIRGCRAMHRQTLSRAEARAVMGHDFWSYGVEANRKLLDYFLAQHHGEGLSSRRVQVDQLFHPATYETFKL